MVKESFKTPAHGTWKNHQVNELLAGQLESARFEDLFLGEDNN